MSFRISRGIWQFKKEDGTYESKYKLATDGRLVETDVTGNEISTFGGAASWDSITGKPSTFSPSAHTHDDRYYTETEVNTLLAGKQAAGSYAAASHTHDDRYLVKGGSWYGVNLPGSRWGGYSVNGGEIVFGRDLPNNGQMGMLIDGAYLAGENNGFWSLNSTNDWSARRGMYYDGTYLNLTTNTPTTRVSSLLSDGTVTMASISGTDQMVENTYGAYLHLGGWGVGRTDASAVLVNTAYRADYATSLFDMNISRFTNNSGYLTNDSSEIITYVYRIHASDGTSPDNFGYNNRYQTFNYGVSSGITGPLLTFGGLGDGYPMQITGAYSGGGNAFAVRTRNGDTGAWNSWRTLITDGNIGSQSVNYAASAGAVAWANVSGKPSTFTPSSHTHAISEVTGLQTALDGKQAAGSYAAASHTHDDRYYTETEINTLLAGKQAAGSYAAASHTHDDRYYTESEINTLLAGKQAAGSYAAASHTHAISDVTGLQSALDGKQAAGSYLTTSGKAADSELIDGIDSSRIIYGDGGFGSTSYSDMNNTAQKSGFFFYNNPTGSPFGDWTHWINSMGNSWNPNYGFQLAHAFHSDRLAVRVVANGGWGSWRTIIDSGNIGSQSVSYAATAGSAPANGGNSSTVAGLAVHGGRNNEANKVVRTDGNGYIQAGWINTTSGDNGTTSISRIYASQDGYIRYYTPANFISTLGLITASNWTSYISSGDARWKTDQYNPLGIYLDPQNLYTQPTQGYAYFSNELAEINNYSGFSLRDRGANVGSLWLNSSGQWNYGTILSLGYYNWNATVAEIKFGWNNGIKWDSSSRNVELYASASEAKLLINGEFHMYADYSNYGVCFAAEFLAMSDASLKTNVTPISNALDKVKALNGVSFHWKKDNKRDFGFIAQDVEQVVPELVSESQQGKAVNYAKTVAILTEAIKEQQTIIEQLMARIDALESK